MCESVSGDSARNDDPEALRAAAVVGLSSIHHEGDWVGDFSRAVRAAMTRPGQSEDAAIREGGALVLRAALGVTMATDLDCEVFRRIARREWKSARPHDIEDVLGRALEAMLRRIDRFERRLRQFDKDPALFPVRSSYKGWCNHSVSGAASKSRSGAERWRRGLTPETLDIPDDAPLPDHEGDRLRLAFAPLLPGQSPWSDTADHAVHSPDAVAGTQNARDLIDQVALQALRSWWRLADHEMQASSCSSAIADGVRRVKPGQQDTYYRKFGSRHSGSVAHRVVVALEAHHRSAQTDPDDERTRLIHFAILAWKCQETEGALAAINQALSDKSVKPERRAARVDWAIAQLSWLASLHRSEAAWIEDRIASEVAGIRQKMTPGPTVLAAMETSPQGDFDTGAWIHDIERLLDEYEQWIQKTRGTR